MFSIRIFAAVIVSLMMFLTGCVTTPMCITSSNTPVNDKNVQENLGATRGSDSAVSILGLWMLGRPDTGEAIEEALNNKKADALINIQCYQKRSYFILFSLTTVIVEGEAVIFNSAGEKNAGKKVR